jgi:hypothetical protein
MNSTAQQSSASGFSAGTIEHGGNTTQSFYEEGTASTNRRGTVSMRSSDLRHKRQSRHRTDTEARPAAEAGPAASEGKDHFEGNGNSSEVLSPACDLRSEGLDAVDRLVKGASASPVRGGLPAKTANATSSLPSLFSRPLPAATRPAAEYKGEMDRALRRLLGTVEVNMRRELPQSDESGKMLSSQLDRINAWYGKSSESLRMLAEDGGQSKLQRERLAPAHIRLESDEAAALHAAMRFSPGEALKLGQSAEKRRKSKLGKAYSTPVMQHHW